VVCWGGVKAHLSIVVVSIIKALHWHRWHVHARGTLAATPPHCSERVKSAAAVTSNHERQEVSDQRRSHQGPHNRGHKRLPARDLRDLVRSRSHARGCGEAAWGTRNHFSSVTEAPSTIHVMLMADASVVQLLLSEEREIDIECTRPSTQIKASNVLKYTRTLQADAKKACDKRASGRPMRPSRTLALTDRTNGHVHMHTYNERVRAKTRARARAARAARAKGAARSYNQCPCGSGAQSRGWSRGPHCK